MRVVLTFRIFRKINFDLCFFSFFFRTGTISCGMPGSRAVCPGSRAVCPDLSFFVRYARKKYACGSNFSNFRKINFDLCFFRFLHKKAIKIIVTFSRFSRKRYACGSNFFFFFEKLILTCVFFRFFSVRTGTLFSSFFEAIYLAATKHSSYGHTTVKAPHPIRTAKLSTVGPDQYFGRGLQGNLECCMALCPFYQMHVSNCSIDEIARAVCLR